MNDLSTCGPRCYTASWVWSTPRTAPPSSASGQMTPTCRGWWSVCLVLSVSQSTSLRENIMDHFDELRRG